jgi:nitrate/TMAO reductase-like tetraheme cytochrome c subunit
MNYIPTAADLLEMSLNNFADHAQELEHKMPQMTREQRAAFIRICHNIAGMENREAA